MKCKKVLAVSVIFSLFMANIAYAANPKVEIAYRGSVEDGLEIEYDDGTVKYADDNAMLMMINGDLISNATIIIKNGTTLVPLRIISEQLKADVAWNAITKTITIVKGSNTIEMKVGNKSAKLNHKSFKMNVAPQIKWIYICANQSCCRVLQCRCWICNRNSTKSKNSLGSG